MSRVALFISVISLGASAGEPQWETVATGAVTVKCRARPKSDVKEVWAEGDLDATVEDLQATLTTMDRFPKFMPYVKSAREVSREPDGSTFNYTELALPVISDRDYVVHTIVDESVQPDGSGTFRCHWAAAPDKLPQRSGRVRLKLCEGSWVITPKDGGKSHFVYRFAADPGGMLPAWIANYGNRHGVSDTLEAIAKEAQRRQKARQAEASAKTAPAPEAVKAAPAPEVAQSASATGAGPAPAATPAPAAAPALAPAPAPPPGAAAAPTAGRSPVPGTR